MRVLGQNRLTDATNNSDQQTEQQYRVDPETGEILDYEHALKRDQVLANKHAKYWAQMRTNLALLERAERIDEKQIARLRAELRDILDLGILSYPPTLKIAGIDPDMSLSEKKLALDVTPFAFHNDDEKRFLKDMSYKADLTRKANWSWRIGQEAAEKNEEQWHPFFVTLTVDPKKTGEGKKYESPKELWQKGREFRLYIRKLAELVCKELRHPPPRKPPYAPESDYVTYAGVIEHGKSREHHHAHIVVWLRAIPSAWRICPNAGIKNPAARTRNECVPMSALWEWSSNDPKTGRSLSPALYFRSIGDVWSIKYEFCLPLKNGKPMKVSVPRTAGAYITKYLSKEHQEWHHRMKATRNLGMGRLKNLLRIADKSVVEALSWRPIKSSTNFSAMQTHSIPSGLLRSEAKRQNYLNRWRLNQLDLTTLLQSNCETFKSMLESVRAGARPDRMASSDFYDWVGQFLPVPNGYSEVRLLAAHTFVGSVFPREKKVVGNHVSIGANRL